MSLADKFKRSEYPIPKMASILKATLTMGPRAWNPSSEAAKEVRIKLERLSKEHANKGVEKAPQKSDQGREERGKGKALDEPQKKRKLIHSNDSSVKFGMTTSHSSKGTPPLPKLMDSAMNALKIVMVRQANEEAARKMLRPKRL